MDDLDPVSFPYHDGSCEIQAPYISPDHDQPFSGELSLMNEMGIGAIPASFHSSNRSMKPAENNQDNHIDTTNKESSPAGQEGDLSTEEIIRVASANFIQLSEHSRGDPSQIMHPFSLSTSSLKPEEKKNVNLVSILLAAAENVRIHRYSRARNLITHLYNWCSSTGNPVQRVVYYFAQGLEERINSKTGRRTSTKTVRDVIQAMLMGNSSQIVFHEKVPFSQIMQFTLTQTLLANMDWDKRIHIIDLSIKFGIQWAIFMQALASRFTCQVEYLKISAVGTSEEAVRATGMRLGNFAKSLGLPLIFKAVIVTDIDDLKEEMFNMEDGEAVGVYSFMNLNTMIGKPSVLENLMRLLRKLKPSIMTVGDVEGNHNSSCFIDRFTEALYYFGAFLDCIDSFMDRNDCNRLFIEEAFLSQGIASIISSDGEDRVVRHVGVGTWRSFFERFRIVETKLGEWSQYEANLLLQQFPHATSCTLDDNGKSLMVGWKGTPLFSVSAWKFL